jgi:beta-lactamase superfamily II metal-dependent hydrolase
MFELTMLPANEGDALILRYGDAKKPSQILIDCGRKATYQELLDHVPEEQRHFELFVVSHIDRDHIEGTLEIVGDKSNGFSFDDIWFNAYRHLIWEDDTLEEFSAKQGEALTRMIEQRDLPWNKAFDGGPVRLDDGDQPVTLTLPGGLVLTLLSPDADKLAKLAPKWEAECRRAGLSPGGDADDPDPDWQAGLESFGGPLETLANSSTPRDGAAPNGSSIAFLAEYDEKTILLGADAHPDLLIRSLARLGRRLPLACDLVKLPHHGSQANVTQALLEHVDCAHYFVSTSGQQFDHPDDVAIARVITAEGPRPRTLYFNYTQKKTSVWDQDADAKDRYGYVCIYPPREGAPLTLSL